MDLRATINGIQYDILQGATFAEEYNETLDSGSIIINNVSKIKGLMPYDDVFIYSFTDSNYKFIGYPFDGTNPQPKFYKHLLVDQFTEEVLRLGDSEEEGRYKYKIELMSETKKLETIQLPNISITQPLEGRKINVWDKAKTIVDLYSPKYKKQVYNQYGQKTFKWEFVNKYSLSETLSDVFGDALAPEKTFNAPTLRSFLSSLFIVKDMIPYVKDDVIYALDISKRNGEFDKNPQNVNIITGSMTSDNYCDNLRRNYSDALSKDGICRSVECVNFRNSDNALMTIENMRIELGYPIYRINKMYMCYYKKINVIHVKKNGTKSSAQQKYILCQQDISKLVKLNTERNALSQDWSDLHKDNIPTSIDEMAKYLFCTVGYDIGSRYIEGWGKFYTYPGFYNDNKYTYVQNLLTRMEYFCPYGILSNAEVREQFKEDDDEDVEISQVYDSSSVFNLWESAQGVNSEEKNGVVYNVFSSVFNPYKNASLGLKAIFFIVDYQGFYNGAIVHSKDNERDNIVINDNTSDSLTLLEQDSIFQKEKVNRFGNKALQINARYKAFWDQEGTETLQQLGSVYNSNYENDVVIYHREYSIFNNYISCVYYGIKNYVLKNWFTSVFAKYRTWRIMSYNESVRRAENEKEYFYWSDAISFYEKENIVDLTLSAATFNRIFSFLTPYTANDIIGIYEFRNDYDINAGYVLTDGKKFYSDVQAFAAGNNLCFNIKMNDNYTQGPFISVFEPFINSINNAGKVFDYSSATWKELFFGNNSKDYAGSKQKLTVFTDNYGYASRLGFYVGHQDNKNLFYFENFKKLNSKNATDKIAQIYASNIFTAPQMLTELNDKIGVEKSYSKDNKEHIDMTLQFENLCLSDNIVLSPWIFKLSDLLGGKHRFAEDIEKEQDVGFKSGIKVYAVQFEGYRNEYTVGTSYGSSTQDVHLTPAVILQIGQNNIRKENLVSVSNIEGLKEIPGIENFEIKFNNLKDEYSLKSQLFHNNFTGGIFLNKFTGKKIQLKFANDTDSTPIMAFLRGELSFFVISKPRVATNYGETSYTEHIISDFAFYLPVMGQIPSFSGTLMPNGIQEYTQCGLNSGDGWVYFATLADDNAGSAIDKSQFNSVFGKAQLLKSEWFPSLISPVSICGGVDMSILADDGQIDPFTNAETMLKKFRYKDLSNNKVISYPISSYPMNDNQFLGVQIGCYLGGPTRWMYRAGSLDYYIPNRGLEWNGHNILDLQKQEISLQIATSQKDKILYHKNMVLLPSDNAINKEIVSKTYTYNELTNKNNLNVKDYMTLNTDENGNSYVSVTPVNNCKSLSLYYLDDAEAYKKDFGPTGAIVRYSYEPNNCLYHFVFGVNFPDGNQGEPYKVYISAVKGKDMRVFDKYHQVVGKSLNYLQHPHAKKWGMQLFESDKVPLVTKSLNDTSWEDIKRIAESDMALPVWNIGDTKTVTTKDGRQYIVRLVETRPGHVYPIDGGEVPHIIFEFVECINLEGQTDFIPVLNPKTLYVGSDIQTTILPSFFDLLPDDLQAVIKEVKYTVYDFELPGNVRPAGRETQGKLFLPSYTEITGSGNVNISQLQYYKTIKKYTKNIVGTETAGVWFLRDSESLGGGTPLLYRAFGSLVSGGDTGAISPFFAI